MALTPYLREPLEIISRLTPFARSVREVVAQKSAQVGWSDGIVCNTLGWMIDTRPMPAIVLFPRERTCRDFNNEKFEPMVEVTECLQDKIPIKSRSKFTTQDRKTFPGGFLKFVGANAPGNVKSTPARLLIVEEPDDCNKNLKGQGDAISLLRERGKRYPDALMLIGGTPTLEGISAVVAEMELSDKRKWFVPCHACGEANPLEWEQVRWDEDPALTHPVWGHANLESVRYFCPSCGVAWTDADKNRNVARAESNGGGWRATERFTGIAGYYFNELMSLFGESRLRDLLQKYLAAKSELDKGVVGPMVTFWNSTLGRPWRWQSGAPAKDVLEQRSDDYELLTVPWGGLVLTLGIDVQHDRLAVVVRAWGRGEESWLVFWGEIYGNPIDKADACWGELDQLIFRAFKHEGGAELHAWAASIDSGDGVTADAVYHYVRTRRAWVKSGEVAPVAVMAVKGSSTASKEIYSKPRESIDLTRKQKATRHGLRPHIVGVSRAKDLLIGSSEGGGRINLTGNGPGRFHCTKQVRGDYWDQILAEVKAPDQRSHKHVLVWQKKPGARNEALDCEVYALHGAKQTGLERWSEAQWVKIEAKLLRGEADRSPAAKPQEKAAAVERPEIRADQDEIQPDSAANPKLPPPNTAKRVTFWPPRGGGFTTNWGR
jgi:phage terminase large subunit GpA-like protein